MVAPDVAASLLASANAQALSIASSAVVSDKSKIRALELIPPFSPATPADYLIRLAH
jgi:hypothetical protein